MEEKYLGTELAEKSKFESQGLAPVYQRLANMSSSFKIIVDEQSDL